MTETYLPTEMELQQYYGLSIQEATIYHRKLEGHTYAEIGEFLNIEPTSVKQIVYNASKKIKALDRTIDIVVSTNNQPPIRTNLALMCFYILEYDLHTEKIYKGRHTMIMKGVKHTIGDMTLIRKSVFPYFNPLVGSVAEARKKAEEFYGLYIKAGGQKGELGIGFMREYATKYQIQMDVY